MKYKKIKSCLLIIINLRCNSTIPQCNRVFDIVAVNDIDNTLKMKTVPM